MEYLQICSFAHKVGQEGEDTYQWAGNLCDLKVERTKKALQEATDKYIICSKNLVSVYEKYLHEKDRLDCSSYKFELESECNKLKLQELVSECNKVTVENVSSHGIWIYKNYTQETIDLIVEYKDDIVKKREDFKFIRHCLSFELRYICGKLSKTVFEKEPPIIARILYDWREKSAAGNPPVNLVETLGELISAYKKIQEQEEELLHTVLQQRIVRKVFERDFKTSAMMEAKREANKATEKAKQAAIDARNAMLAADEAVRLAEEAEESEDETLKKKQDETLIAFSGTGRGDDDTDRKSYNEEIKIYNKTIKL